MNRPDEIALGFDSRVATRPGLRELPLMQSFDRTNALVLLPLALLALAPSCRTATASRPTAEADAPSTPPPSETNPAPAAGYTEADVRFLQGMIPHHAQAMVMADLVPGRTENEEIHRLARRIEISQRDEIARMSRWLEARDEALPDPEAHVHGPLMPGMLTEAQMASLAAAAGPEFDRLFLELMIEHHRGALVMVEDLHSTGAGGAEPEIYLLATHIDADQRAEIARMLGMLETMEPGGTR